MKKYLLLLFMAFIAFACSDDKDSPVSPNPSVKSSDLFPMTEGSYWIYNTVYEIEGSTEEETDSTYVKGTITKLDKTGKIFISVNAATNETNEVYYSVDGSKIFTFSNYLASVSMDGFPTDELFEEQWLQVVDSADADWKIIKTDKETRTIDMGGQQFEVEVQIEADGARLDDSMIEVAGQNILCQNYSIDMSVDVKLKLLGMSFSIDLNQEVSFAKGIGMVQQKQNPFEIEIPMLGSQQMPGMVRKLLRYNIK